MISLPAKVPIVVVHQPVSFGCGIDGMRGLCLKIVKQDPLDFGYFLFINKAHNQLRALWFDGQGFCLFTKRLSQGRFHHWPRPGQSLFSVVAYFQAQGLLAGHKLEDKAYLPIWQEPKSLTGVRGLLLTIPNLFQQDLKICRICDL